MSCTNIDKDKQISLAAAIQNILRKNNLPLHHPQGATPSGPCTFDGVKNTIKKTGGCLARSRRREKFY